MRGFEQTQKHERVETGGKAAGPVTGRASRASQQRP